MVEILVVLAAGNCEIDEITDWTRYTNTAINDYEKLEKIFEANPPIGKCDILHQNRSINQKFLLLQVSIKVSPKH